MKSLREKDFVADMTLTLLLVASSHPTRWKVLSWSPALYPTGPRAPSGARVSIKIAPPCQ